LKGFTVNVKPFFIYGDILLVYVEIKCAAMSFTKF
jgi:hypothetical protein